jgi:site-specific DNA-cytosine methylase
MNKEINVISFFDGMGCLYYALKRNGYKIKNYFAFEIDKFAIELTSKTIPNIKHMGSIKDFNLEDFGELSIDVVGAGSPC